MDFKVPELVLKYDIYHVVAVFSLGQQSQILKVSSYSNSAVQQSA